MPTVNFDKKEFSKLLGKKLNDKELEENISMMGVGVDSINEKEIVLEVFPNRPDLLSEYNLARALNSFLGIKSGLKEYKTNKSNYELFVDNSVNEVRPFTCCCIVKDLKLDDDKIKQIIQLQEKLHISYCRNRKKCAIGIYPLEKIKIPITYKALLPKEIKFKPLESKAEMTGNEILEDHPKGKEYAYLLKDCKKYPVFIDANKQILSMPPIINSDETGKVELNTKEVFIECSGFDLEVLNKCLNIIAVTLAEMGGKIYSMKMHYGNKIIESPNLEPEEMRLDLDYVNKRIGIELKNEEAKKLLMKMEYGIKGDKILVPCYRTDILHEIDLVEDIAIAYGYDKLKEEIPKVATIAEESKFEVFRNKICDILIGFGLLECNTYNLDSKDNQSEKMNISIEFVGLANALNEEYNVLRSWVTPSLMRVLKENKHNEYPQNLFCTGRCFKKDEKSETKVEEFVRLSIVLSNNNANFTQIKQILDGLFSALDLKYEIKETEHGSFIEGRVGRIIVDDKEVAYIGEINPKVLENFGLEMPVAALELNLEELFRL